MQQYIVKEEYCELFPPPKRTRWYCRQVVAYCETLEEAEKIMKDPELEWRSRRSVWYKGKKIKGWHAGRM